MSTGRGVVTDPAGEGVARPGGPEGPAIEQPVTRGRATGARTSHAERVRRAYVALALLLLNSLLAFALVNVVVAAAFAVKDYLAPLPFRPGALAYGLDRLTAAYPGRDPAALEAMLLETWTRPFERSGLLGFREAAFAGRHVNVAPAGMRWNCARPTWPPSGSALNVFVFGGSTVFGYGVDDCETIPAAIERQLRATRSPSERVAVYNFGQGWYFSVQELVLFESLLRDGFVPDLAVFVDGLNEFEKQGREEPFLPLVQREPSSFAGLPVLRLARAVQRRLPVGTAAPPDPRDVDAASLRSASEPEEIIGRYLRTQEMIRGVAAASGVATIHVWQPVPEYAYDTRHHLFFERAVRVRAEGYAAFAARSAAWQQRGDALDLAEMRRDRHEALCIDGHHYSPQMCEEIGARIAAAIEHRLNGLPVAPVTVP